MRRSNIDKTTKELAKESKKELGRQLNCSICPPNKGENAKRQSKHGNKKPKYKNKRG